MKVIILGAGYATRLYPLTLTRPKPLLPVAGKPMIDYVLDNLAPIGGIDRVIIVTNAKFADHFQKWADDYRANKAKLDFTIVNDGSTDDTLSRLQQYGSRIQVLDLANGGVARARNAGVKLATGSWIAFLDADDLWRPEKIERQLSHSDAPLRYTDRLNIGARGDLPELQSLVTPM